MDLNGHFTRNGKISKNTSKKTKSDIFVQLFFDFRAWFGNFLSAKCPYFQSLRTMKIIWYTYWANEVVTKKFRLPEVSSTEHHIRRNVKIFKNTSKKPKKLHFCSTFLRFPDMVWQFFVGVMPIFPKLKTHGNNLVHLLSQCDRYKKYGGGGDFRRVFINSYIIYIHLKKFVLEL